MDKPHPVNVPLHPNDSTSEQVNLPEPSLLRRNNFPPPPKQGSNNWVYLLPEAEQRSHLLLPWLGYGLLVFALFNYIHILIPLGLTNPEWELLTIGALVEQAAIPLLGLSFIFYRRQGYINTWERMLMRCLSWVALLLGLFYLLLIPLGVADTWRLYQAVDAQITAQSQPTEQLQSLKEQLHQAKTEQQLKQVLVSVTPPAARAQIQYPQALKDKLLVTIGQAQQNLQLQTQGIAANQKLVLLKNSLKWNLGALLSGCLLILFWQLTNWVRRNRYWE